METLKKPNYILLGASKSATTSIYDVLRQNLNVFAPQFKEPHFFNIDDIEKLEALINKDLSIWKQ